MAENTNLRLVHTSCRSLWLLQRARPLQVAAKIWKKILSHNCLLQVTGDSQCSVNQEKYTVQLTCLFCFYSVTLLVLCLYWMNNNFTWLVKSKQVKQEVSRTMIHHCDPYGECSLHLDSYSLQKGHGHQNDCFLTWMRLGLVTVKSSPTIWISVLPVRAAQPAQSSYCSTLKVFTNCPITLENKWYLCRISSYIS